MTRPAAARLTLHVIILRRRRGEPRTEWRWTTSVARSKPYRRSWATFTRFGGKKIHRLKLLRSLLPWDLCFVLSSTVVFITTQLVGGEVDGDENSSSSLPSSPLLARSPLRNATLMAVQGSLSKHQQQVQVSAACLLIADVLKLNCSYLINTNSM